MAKQRRDPTKEDGRVRMIDEGRVRLARDRRLPDPEIERLAQLFRLLSDANRARLLYALLDTGELCVCDLAAATGCPETNVSHALRLLRTAGVVQSRRDGRTIHYSLDDAHVRRLLDLCREHLRDDNLDDRPAPRSSRNDASSGRALSR